MTEKEFFKEARTYVGAFAIPVIGGAFFVWLAMPGIINPPPSVIARTFIWAWVGFNGFLVIVGVIGLKELAKRILRVVHLKRRARNGDPSAQRLLGDALDLDS